MNVEEDFSNRLNYHTLLGNKDMEKVPHILKKGKAMAFYTPGSQSTSVPSTFITALQIQPSFKQKLEVLNSKPWSS